MRRAENRGAFPDELSLEDKRLLVIAVFINQTLIPGTNVLYTDTRGEESVHVEHDVRPDARLVEELTNYVAIAFLSIKLQIPHIYP